VLSRLLIKKQPGRRWLTYVAGLGVLVATLAVATVALAVHDLSFQLDGDTSSVAQNNPNDPDPAPAKDWNDVFTTTGGNTTLVDPNGGNGSFTAASFKRDFAIKASKNAACSDTATIGAIFCTVDTSTYATGSKDILDIPEWQCNKDNNVNSKIDIMNAYAAQFQASDGDRIMYFGLEKNVDNGNNNVAFWFLKDGSVNCSSTGSAIDFSGTHKDGDVLVVSAFTNGGGVSNIDAYRWDGTDSCIDNPDEPGDCDELAVASGGDCKAANALDDICATTNSGPNEENDAITTKWLTSNGSVVGNSVVPPDFFEGGINLTEVLGGAACFSTFIADTRSSQSLSATLFDFARGQLGGCQTTLTTKTGLSTTPITGEVAAPNTIGSGSVSSGTDTASLSVTGSQTWGGALSFYLCGPDTSLTTCDQTKGVKVTERAVSNSSPATDFVSGTATLTSAGKYCWSAHFEPNQASKDAGISADDDQGGALECFTVAPVNPTLTTQATCSADPCILGSSLRDTASLTGTATQPGSGGGGTAAIYTTINPSTLGANAGGTISWVLFAPSNGGCADTRTTTPTSVTVSGDSPPAYGPVSYATQNNDPVGTYTFVANYGGNLPNTTAPTTTNTCAEPGANERVTVIGSVTSATKQRWLPNDRIVLTTNAGVLDGSLTATLYFGNFTVTNGTCTANAGAVNKYSITIDTSPSGVPSASGTAFHTANTSVFVGSNVDGSAAGANGTYFWLIHYDDLNLDDPKDRCETTSITVTD
jgi:hypothetical protein